MIILVVFLLLLLLHFFDLPFFFQFFFLSLRGINADFDCLLLKQIAERMKKKMKSISQAKLLHLCNVFFKNAQCVISRQFSLKHDF